MKLLIFSLIIFIFIGCGEKSKRSTHISEDSKLLVLFVHGFTGKINLSRFTQDMQPILSKYNPNYIVETYSWDSEGISKNPLKNWNEANQKAIIEAEKLAEQIEIYEDEETPYYLIGYSLGAKVVIESLKQSDDDLEMLRGVYLLGAADDVSQKIDTGLFNENFKITNYHSPYHDKILKRLYRAAEFMKKAGGQKGFENEEEFKNYQTGASHSPSDGKCNFLNMSKSIAHLIAYNENQFLPDLNTTITYSSKSSYDDNRWNNLIKFKNYTIQQNSCDIEDNNYRVIDNNFSIKLKDISLPMIFKEIRDNKI